MEEPQEPQTKTYWKTYYENNKEKVCQRNKAYRDKNSEKLKEECKKYWQEKGDTIKARRKVLIECPLCLIKTTRESFSRHKVSKLHISKLPIIENIEELKSIDNV
jgi:hypothetical protein